MEGHYLDLAVRQDGACKSLDTFAREEQQAAEMRRRPDAGVTVGHPTAMNSRNLRSAPS